MAVVAAGDVEVVGVVCDGVGVDDVDGAALGPLLPPHPPSTTQRNAAVAAATVETMGRVVIRSGTRAP
jgi:hypothetical protein